MEKSFAKAKPKPPGGLDKDERTMIDCKHSRQTFRFSVLVVLLVSPVAILLSGVSAFAGDAPSRPNIVFILADDKDEQTHSHVYSGYP